MFYFLTKAALSGLIAAIVSDVAKRSPAFGALVASLPLISIMAIIWLWRDTGDTNRIASHMEATFWYVLPSLPMFLLIPAMLRGGIGFWTALIFRLRTHIGFVLDNELAAVYRRGRRS